MSRTFISQNSQVFSSENYNDSFASGSALRTNAGSLEDDLNALRTQVKQILYANQSGSWYDGIGSRGLSQLNSDVDGLASEFAVLSSSLVTTNNNLNDLETNFTALSSSFVTNVSHINDEISSINTALTTLSGTAHRTRFNAGVKTSVNANTNVTFPDNLDAPLGDYTTADFASKVNVHLNGVLLLPGTSESNANDVYPGTSAATGDLKFPYHIRSGSQISMEVFSTLL